MASPDSQKPVVTGNSASRVAAHRSRHKRLDVSVSLQMGDTIAALALHYGCSEAEVVRSWLRFASTGRDWYRQGLIWRD